MKKIGWVCAVMVLALALPAMAGSTRSDDITRIKNSTDIFRDLVDAPDSDFPLDLLQSAQCVAIIPSELQAAFIVGGKYGKGIVTCRVGPHAARQWSAPAFVMISGGSFGFQIGGSATDLVLVFRNRTGLKKLLSDKFKIGGSATAAAGPLGRSAEASTDLQLHAEILSYSRSRGVFAGVSLNGAVFQPDDSGNHSLYGDGARSEAILNGKYAAPPEFSELQAELKKYAL